MDILSGLGLATSSGLNAYIPLLVLGLLDRYTSVIDLGPGFSWLANGWILLIITVLLIVEVLADKFPAIDSINDAIQTVVRPSSGGIVFGSAATANIAGIDLGGQTATVADPESFFSSHSWIPVVTGIVIALVVHLTKMIIRPVANTATGGASAPILSTVEDIFAAVLSVLAILLPILVIIGVALVVVGAIWVRRRARAKKATRHWRDEPVL